MRSELREISRQRPEAKHRCKPRQKKAAVHSSPEGAYLARIYATITKRPRYKLFNQAQMTCFSRLAVKLGQHGITDCVTFFAAQIASDRELFVGQLISDYALERYYQHLEISRVYVPPDDFSDEESMLSALCRVRQETSDAVLCGLKDSGIFSMQFLALKGVPGVDVSR